MFPDIQLFGKTLTWYGLCVLAGILAVFFYLYLMPKRQGLDETHGIRMGLFSAIGIFFGGALLYGLTKVRYLILLLGNLDKVTSFSHLLALLADIFGGSVFYGGLIGCLLVSWLYLRKNKLPLGPYSDLGAPTIALFHSFGRLGCFLSGCCYGIPWSHGWTYHYSHAPDANGVPRFPVQLLESALELALFVLLFTLWHRGKAKGKLLGLWLVVYPICRFLLEFLRGDDYRGFLWGLSTSQWISIPLLLFGIALLWNNSRTSRSQHS